MRRTWVVIFLCATLLTVVGSVFAQTTTPSPTSSPIPTSASTSAPTIVPTPTSSQEYIVLPGDNLFRIAIRFRTTTRALADANGIVNPSVIYVGQRLTIPGGFSATSTPVPGATATPVAPTVTPVPGTTTTYVVQRGDTLFRIAIRNNTTVARVVSANNIANPNIIFVGQQLQIPSAGTTAATTGTTTVPITAVVTSAVSVTTQATVAVAATQVTPEATVGVSSIPENTAENVGFAYGVNAHLPGQDPLTIADTILDLGVTWVRQDIDWRLFEPVKGQIDFEAIDSIVDTLDSNGFNILFTVSTSPEWARTSTEEDGPPDNFQDYADFVGAVASRYAGRVDAYQIWSEPNLRREWNSTIHSISATNYLNLLTASYSAIKTADSNATVVSAGLSPTGFNDGVNAINDRGYLRDLYTSGVSAVSDAIGAHPGGWANPPDAVCCAAAVGVETHFEDPSFYFLNTLRDYRQIMAQFNDVNTFIWVTKFGWGTSEDTTPPSSTYIFLTYTTLGEQAIYNPRGFELGNELDFVGPMFLYNLNSCQARPDDVEGCFYSLIGPTGQARPVYDAIKNLIDGVDTSATATEEVVTEAQVPPTAETVTTVESPPVIVTEESVPTEQVLATATP